MAVFKLMHLLSVLVWVGGMFFAYMVLRPSAAEVLQPPQRLPLWNDVFRRFFIWVWIAILLIFASGLAMIYQFGGMQQVPKYVHIMLMLGTIMTVIFAYVYFVAYAKFKLSVNAADWPKSATNLATIRKIVGTNLLIGVLIMVIVELSR